MMMTRAALIAATLAVAGAVHAQTPDDGKRLHKMVEAYWDELEELNPVLATFNGNNEYNDRFSISISPEHVAKSLALEKKYLAEVESIDANRLQGQDRLTHAIFKRVRASAIEGFEFPAQLLPISQFGGVPQFLAQMGSGTGLQPFKTTADYDNWLKRVSGFPLWCDQAIVNMREGIAAGLVQPRVLIEKVIPQLDALIVEDPKQSIYHKPVETFPDAVPQSERARLTAAYEKMIGEKIIPAYRKLRDYTRDEYLPKTRASIAVTELPNGKRWYAYLVRQQTTTSLTPEQIHDLGLSEVARLRGEMQKVMREVKFEGTLEQFFEFMTTDPRFYFQKEEDLLNGYRSLKAGVAERLPKLFAERPAADFEIRAIEPFRARSGPGGQYQAATPDGSRPGIFYANTYDLTSRPSFAMDALYLHEAEPGHHFQISIQRELGELPRFRRFGGFTAYSEGWGLYAESLGKELGLYSDPYRYFGGLSSEMYRAIRLVVDTGMHAKGWTREQSITYMRANRPVGETVAVSETERYIAIPGQALSYKIGELKIKELRARAAAALGPKFDVREFHTQVLTNGAMPLDVLEAEVDRWIAARRK
jgi:uncharacterized protein (DUF885 family)